MPIGESLVFDSDETDFPNPIIGKRIGRYSYQIVDECEIGTTISIDWNNNGWRIDTPAVYLTPVDDFANYIQFLEIASGFAETLDELTLKQRIGLLKIDGSFVDAGIKIERRTDCISFSSDKSAIFVSDNVWTNGGTIPLKIAERLYRIVNEYIN